MHAQFADRERTAEKGESVLSRRLPGGAGVGGGLLHDLQRTAGNRAVGRWISRASGPLAKRPPRPGDTGFEWPRISIRTCRAIASGSPGGPDKGPDESALQDQSASVTSLTTHAEGVEIYVEAQGVYTSDEFPDGFKWTQTIDTNVPKGGTTSPYVDPRPNDDTKPFYYTDAEHAASPTTFYDRPARSAPASGTTQWEAILGLNGVDEATKTVQGFDFLTYGFTIDAAGTVTQIGPSSTTGANHQSTLASEFPDWTFT